MVGRLRKLLLPTILLLASCATSWDEEEARCRAIDDDAARRACLERVLAEDQSRGDNNGIGPPSCHPASTRPDPDRERC